jgi:ligand-binding sensor domain-containing protein
VSSITQDYAGNYWIGTWGNGINKLKYKDKYSPSFIQFYNSGKPDDICSNFVAAMASDAPNKGVWVGTREGIDFLDITTGKFRHVLNYLPKNQKIHFVTGMQIDSKRRLWVGTNYGLLCIYLNETSLQRNKIKYKLFRYQLTNPQSLVYEKINCILETKDKTIWFGSNGNGIYKLQEKEDRFSFVNFDEKNGLLEQVYLGCFLDLAVFY